MARKGDKEKERKGKEKLTIPIQIPNMNKLTTTSTLVLQFLIQLPHLIHSQKIAGRPRLNHEQKSAPTSARRCSKTGMAPAMTKARTQIIVVRTIHGIQARKVVDVIRSGWRERRSRMYRFLTHMWAFMTPAMRIVGIAMPLEEGGED